MSQNNEHARISRGLYKTMNCIIGPEIFIDIRRTTTNLRDSIMRVYCDSLNAETLPCYSGSKCEGLRKVSSDEDWIYIYTHIKVVPSPSYVGLYDRYTTILLMENDMTKPGFTLLRLIGKPISTRIPQATEKILNGIYVSSSKWRETHTEAHRELHTEYTHGPCISGLVGTMEYDKAYCLQSDLSPENARDCIKRLHQCKWPSYDTVLSIVSDGVLFVPIGAKQSSFENIDWRMSFSLAEKKLVHSMNHVQFLCYALLKILLKEAIDVNNEVKGLLCSYFFWKQPFSGKFRYYRRHGIALPFCHTFGSAFFDFWGGLTVHTVQTFSYQKTICLPGK